MQAYDCGSRIMERTDNLKEVEEDCKAIQIPSFKCSDNSDPNF